jgi:hypothetical protein
MPTVEVAVAAIVTTPETVALLLGDVIEVPIPVALTMSVTRNDCGELDA